MGQKDPNDPVEALKRKPEGLDGRSYFSNKRRKIKEQFAESSGKSLTHSQLFSKVVVYVNGYTRPSARELEALVYQHGGQAEKMDSSRVTHMVANTLPSAKIFKIMDLKGLSHKPVVSPQWILDCVDQKKLVPCAPYILRQLKPKVSITKMFTNINAKSSMRTRQAETDGDVEMKDYPSSGQHTSSSFGRRSYPLFARSGPAWDQVLKDLGTDRRGDASTDKLSFTSLAAPTDLSTKRAQEKLYRHHEMSHFVAFEDSPMYSKSTPQAVEVTIHVLPIERNPLPADERYISRFYSALESFTESIFPVGELEAFVVFPTKILTSGLEWMRQQLNKHVGRNFRLAMASNKILACIANKANEAKNEPISHVEEGFRCAVISQTGVGSVPFLGSTLKEKLRRMGVKACADCLLLQHQVRTEMSKEDAAFVRWCADGKDPCFEEEHNESNPRILDEVEMESIIVPRKLKSKIRNVPKAGISHAAQPKGGKNWIRLPDFHDLNKDVIRQLPKEIRKELAAAYKKRHCSRAFGSKVKPTPVRSEGTHQGSHGSNENPQKRLREKGEPPLTEMSLKIRLRGILSSGPDGMERRVNEMVWKRKDLVKVKETLTMLRKMVLCGHPSIAFRTSFNRILNSVQCEMRRSFLGILDVPEI